MGSDTSERIRKKDILAKYKANYEMFDFSGKKGHGRIEGFSSEEFHKLRDDFKLKMIEEKKDYIGS